MLGREQAEVPVVELVRQQGRAPAVVQAGQGDRGLHAHRQDRVLEQPGDGVGRGLVPQVAQRRGRAASHLGICIAQGLTQRLRGPSRVELGQ